MKTPPFHAENWLVEWQQTNFTWHFHSIQICFEKDHVPTMFSTFSVISMTKTKAMKTWLSNTVTGRFLRRIASEIQHNFAFNKIWENQQWRQACPMQRSDWSWDCLICKSAHR